MDLLPEDLLDNILRRLQPRPLALCRSVCKDLRAAVDGRGLLLALAHRVPRGLRGIFVNYVGQDRPYFFSRPAPASGPRIDAELTFLPGYSWREVVHHCNGLLLLELGMDSLYVCNPTTQRWEELPPRPGGHGAEHLLFDPTVSLHYHVFVFPHAPAKPKIPIHPGIKRPSWFQGCREYDPKEIKKLPPALIAQFEQETNVKGSVEWPPSSYVAQVFSSRTGRWEERAYVREEDDVAVTIHDVWSDPWAPGRETLTYNAPRCNAVHWRGAFYIHCRGGFVMRLSLLEDKYQVIKTPPLDNVFTKPRLKNNRGWGQECVDREQPSMHLAKSEHGVYYTALRWHQLQVWVLREEASPTPEWELKHTADIGPSFLEHFMRVESAHDNDEEIEQSWMLDRGKEGPEGRSWDSSDDSIDEEEEALDNGLADFAHYDRYSMDLLGFHPDMEILFLGNYFDGFAYYLGSSKLQYLGSFDPVGCCHHMVAATHESFIYTPCSEDLLPARKNKEKHELEDYDDTDHYSSDENGDLEEEVDEDTDEDEDLEGVEDEGFESSEDDQDNGIYENVAYKDELL